MDPTGVPTEPTLREKIDAADIIWVPIPFSRSELMRGRKHLARDVGLLTTDGVVWQEIRTRLGMQEKPTGFKKGNHYAFHQGPRPWLTEEE